MKQCYFSGEVTPPGGGGVPSTMLEGQRIGGKGVYMAPKASRKFSEYFLNIFGKFVNKNAIKSGFWGDLGRNIPKISKKTIFRSFRDISTKTLQNYIYQGAETPSPKITLI